MAVVNGVRLHYVIGGKEPCLVLLHGLPATWYEWRRIFSSLAERYTVVAPDLRGLGDSAKPGGGYDTHTAAEAIHQLVGSLGFEWVFVAGHDWGAAVGGGAYAARHRQEVRKLAILNRMNIWAIYRSIFDDVDRNRESAKIKLPMPVLALGGERTMAERVGGKANSRCRGRPARCRGSARRTLVVHDAPDFVADQLVSFFVD